MRFVSQATLLTLLALYGATPNSGQVLTTLFRFTGKTGAYSEAPVIFGSTGALYGTTIQGGAANKGAVFQLTPSGTRGKPWIETVLYSCGTQAGAPVTPNGVIFDTHGSLYGTSINGGTSTFGAAFELTPPAGGSGPWTETPLHSFTGGSDGATPAGNLTFGLKAALYGVTTGGGAASLGTIFELTPPAGGSGPWTESVLYSFGSQSGDGATPVAGLRVGSKGQLYGTTSAGGAANMGIVFELAPPTVSGGAWTETVLYSFSGGADGGKPSASLTIDSQGALYGTTFSGGSANLGTVFKLAPPTVSGGTWTESVLYSFQGGNDGANPQANVVFNKSGALYGTTGAGGFDNLGTVFKLAPPAPGGSWTETVLNQFEFSDGSLPVAGLTLNASGILFGTTENGGTPEKGTVFALTP